MSGKYQLMKRNGAGSRQSRFVFRCGMFGVTGCLFFLRPGLSLPETHFETSLQTDPLHSHTGVTLGTVANSTDVIGHEQAWRTSFGPQPEASCGQNRSLTRIDAIDPEIAVFSASRWLAPEFQPDIRRLDESQHWMKYQGSLRDQFPKTMQ